MANENQAGKMILAHIGMFNEATIFFSDVVEPAVQSAIDECVEVFANAEEWCGKFEFATNADCRLAPAQWNKSEKKSDFDSKAWFAVGCIEDMDDYWSALLCNQGSAGGEAGFVFEVDNGVYGTKSKCSQYLSKLSDDKFEQLRKFGFELVEYKKGKKTFFMKITLNADSLAETWGNNGEFSETDPCFEPVKDALEKLKKALPIFDDILKVWPVKT